MKKRILNLGCGESTYGTDFVDIYPMRKEVKKCDIDKDKLPYKSNAFDEVFSSFVFEHLTSPRHALQEMYRVLKKGGKVVIHTNNAGYLWFHNAKSKIKTHYGGYETLEKHSGDEDKHYALYTFHHLENQLGAVGFKNVRTRLYVKSYAGVTLVIKLINWLVRKTRFRWITYPSIHAQGIK